MDEFRDFFGLFFFFHFSVLFYVRSDGQGMSNIREFHVRILSLHVRQWLVERDKDNTLISNLVESTNKDSKINHTHTHKKKENDKKGFTERKKNKKGLRIKNDDSLVWFNCLTVHQSFMGYLMPKFDYFLNVWL